MQLSHPSRVQKYGDLSVYAPALRRYFRKRVDSAEIEDLTQDVFLNMHSRGCVARIDNLEGYLFCVASRLVSRHLTLRRLQRPAIAAAVESEYRGPQAPSAEEEVLSREKMQRLAATLEALPPRAREVFLLHRFEGMSYQAIAHRLNISVSAIEKHIMIALKALRTQLQGET